MMSKTILDVLTLGDLMVDFTPAGIFITIPYIADEDLVEKTVDKFVK